MIGLIVSCFLLLFPSLSAAAETIIVTVVLNQQSKGEFFVIAAGPGDYLVRIEDLKAMGFRAPEGQVTEISGERYVSLKSMKGIQFTFDEKKVALEIAASPALLPVNQINLAPLRPEVYYPRETSAFLNYGITYSDSNVPNTAAYGVANEVGFRTGDFLFLSGSNYTKTYYEDTFVRLMSSITYDRREDMQRAVAGDFFASSGIFGGTENLGGISFSKVYSINPYFIKFPLFNFNGLVSMPSDVDIYLNGMKVRTEKVSPGEFDLKNLAIYGGAGVVDVVVKDAFGREQKIAFPFYSADILLRQGLNEYSYNVGFLRQNFGVESNDYGDPAAAMFHRYGVNDSLTLGGRAEATKGLFTFGPEASFLLSRFGVMTLSAYTSDKDGEGGYAGSLNYTYQGKVVSARLFANAYTSDFETISRVTTTTTSPKLEEGASIGIGGKELGSLSFSYTAAENYNAPDTQSAAITYSRNLTKDVILFTSLSRSTQGEAVNNEFFIGLTYTPWRDVAISVRHDRNGETNTDGVQVQKNLPVGEGVGYQASLDRTETDSSTTYRANPSVQYNARYGVYGADYVTQRNDSGTQTSYRLTAGGAIAYVGNTVGLTRPVTDSFALVRAGDLAGITVYDNNQDVGKTDSSGKLFVPNLGSYYDNRLSINDKDVPLNYTLSETGLFVSPPLRSGSCIFFGVKQEQPVTGTLAIKIDGVVKPVEFREGRMEVDGKEIVFPTGSNGEFYIEGVPSADKETGPGKRGCSYKAVSGKIEPGTYKASFDYEGKRCMFNITIPKTDDMIIDLGQVVCEMQKAAPQVPQPQAVPPAVTPPPVQKPGPVTMPAPVQKPAPPAEGAAEDNPPQSFVLKLAFDKGGRPSSKTDKAALALIVRMLKKDPALAVEIEVSGDRHGSDEASIRIGRKKAETLRRYLVASGIRADRIKKTESIGKKKLICEEQTAACDKLNRRGVIRIAQGNPGADASR